jgi:hypothetical protein
VLVLQIELEAQKIQRCRNILFVGRILLLLPLLVQGQYPHILRREILVKNQKFILNASCPDKVVDSITGFSALASMESG